MSGCWFLVKTSFMLLRVAWIAEICGNDGCKKELCDS